MAALKFTKHQQQAIDVTGGNILVSAAAGSGKTAVLTERVIKLLTGENPVSADKLVIVTYTVAAADEMRRRISGRLAELLEQNPADRLLQNQQLLLSNARISSIHALCSGLIRENFQVLGLSRDIKIAEETQLTLLKNEAVDEVLDRWYEEGTPAFLSLVEFTCTKDDKKLVSLVLAVYDFIRSFSFPLSFLEETEGMYEQANSIKDCAWIEGVSSHILDALGYSISILKGCLQEMETDETVREKYAPSFQSDLVQFEQVEKLLLQGEYSKASDCLMRLDKLRLGAVRKYGTPEFLDYLKARRDRVYDIAGDIKKKYMSYSEEDFKADITLLTPQIKTLFSVVREVYAEIDEKKQAIHVMDYADLEHYTVKLLVNQTAQGLEKTELAAALSESIEQIMVDECQDINEVQNLIFKLLSKQETNLFMVGDVKQSIYRFRQAMPKLFMDKRKHFPIYEESQHTPTATGTITLESNFRSRKEVCDIVNYIFGQIMTEEMGEIAYTEEESLVAGAAYEPQEDAFPEVHILDYGKEEDDTEKSIVEARYVAGLIRRMVAEGFQVTDGGEKRGCSYRDFAILLRKKKDIAAVYANELTANGVPCYSDSTEGYFGEYEIMVMVNFLRVIDNPLLDVPLLSVLLSPMASFSADKVTQVRLAKKNVPLYLALISLAEQGDSGCQQFVALLAAFRQKAALLSTDEIIQEIYDQTDFIAISNAMGNGDKKNANLRLLLTYAKQYEKIGANGLSGFVRYIDRVMESKQDFSCANISSGSADTVKIMSIHSSKGLEFPVCILADCAKGFNKRDINTYPYQMNAELGFSMKITDAQTLRCYNSLPFEAIRLKREKETISEEMRVLYVALTRAKEKLIMVMTFENAQKKLQNMVDACNSSTIPSPFEVYSSNNFAGWLIAALIRHPGFESIRQAISRTSVPIRAANFSVKGYLVQAVSAASAEKEQEGFIARVSAPIEKVLEENFSFRYADQPLTSIPAKLTVTQIAKQAESSKVTLKARPDFMQKQGITPAERGTILHNFMQFADFSHAKADLRKEINRLITQKYMLAEQAKALDLPKIQSFLNSPLYERMCACEIQREYPFNFFLRAGEVDSKLSPPYSEAQILIQGIADCLLFEPDGIVIVDYKTDYVKEETVLVDRYENQLRLYRTAIEKTFEQPVKQCLLYALSLEREVDIPLQ